MILVTNDDTSRAIRNYSYRFGSIECIFKFQKSNGFRLESTNTQKVEHFISLFTVMCVALVWLTIIGADYVRNKHKYSLKIRDVKRHKNNTTSRVYSFFNLWFSCSFSEKPVNFFVFPLVLYSLDAFFYPILCYFTAV